MTPFHVEHGGCPDFSAFRFGSLVYISDISAFPEGSREYLRGAKQVVIDGLRHEEVHPSHFTIEQTLEELKNGFYIGLVPEEVWFVGMCHAVDHDITNTWLLSQELPCRVACAYDTQQLVFEIYDHGSEIPVSVDTQ